MATQIQIKRGSTTPAGLTVGESAMNTSTNQIYLGGTGGTVLVGGEVTGGVDMGAGSAVSANRIPTQSGVYNYVRNSTVTSFNGATGAVTGVASIGGFTGTVTVTDGTYITVRKSSNDITFTNTGVQTFNGLTGAVTGVSAAVGSTYLTVSGSTGSVTFTNTGVQTFNGLTGAVTGVTVGGANTFTALNSFNAGISASALTVSGGATFSSNVYLGDAATGVTADSNDYVMMMGGTGSAAFKSGFYQTYKFLAGSTSGVICVTPAFNPASYLSGSATLEITISYTQNIAGPATSNPRVHKIIMPIKWDGNSDLLALGDYTESITNSNSSYPPLNFTFAIPAPYTRLSISTTTGADVFKSYSGWGFRTTVQVH